MVFIFETHPVQYRAPLYQELQKLFPDRFKVFYASDCSVRGHHDAGFNATVKWDTPLLQGYPHEILANEHGAPLTTFRSLTGKGIFRLLRSARPSRILLCQFSHEYSWTVFLSAVILRIPVWIRQETQDEAFERTVWKQRARSLFYRCLYQFVQGALFIGALNRAHLIKHGMHPNGLFPAPYCVSTPLIQMSQEEKQERRDRLRSRLGVASTDFVISFFGKLIPKKDPALLLQAYQLLDPLSQSRTKLLFVGNGELQSELERSSESAGIPAIYPGFINQSEISDYYLASDLVVLPSRRAGETWGLVVNEGLHAGCAVIVSEAVGASAEFAGLDRVRVIPVGDAAACALAMAELSRMPRSFTWADQALFPYSIPQVARGFHPLFN